MQFLQVFAATCGGAGTVLINCDDQTNGAISIIGIVINILLSLVAILAVGGIIYADITYLASR